MSFNVANNGATIPAKFDGALRMTYGQGKDYIVEGVGSEFAITHSTSSLQVQVGTGVANICGRGMSADSSNTITLQANSQIWLCLRIDLSQTQGSEGMLYANTSSNIKTDNLSNGSGQHDLLLAVINTNSRGVASIQDRRLITSKAGGFEYEVIQTL